MGCYLLLLESSMRSSTVLRNFLSKTSEDHSRSWNALGCIPLGECLLLGKNMTIKVCIFDTSMLDYLAGKLFGKQSEKQ